MFYYFIPRCEVTGTITHRGVTHELTQGQGWYDHEFGVGIVDDPNPEAEAALGAAACAKLQTERRARWDARQVGWNWISAQLDDGSELTYYPEQYVYSGESAGEHALTIGPKGEVQHWQGAKFEPIGGTWYGGQSNSYSCSPCKAAVQHRERCWDSGDRGQPRNSRSND